MIPFPALLEARLADLQERSQYRELRPRGGLDFTSNDYLGFAEDPVLTERFRASLDGLPLGASGSRLLRGELPLHQAIEAELATFVGREAAVLFPSGYQANVGLLTSVLRPGDLVFSDELNHASIIDGIRLSKATRAVYPHGDLETLRRLLQRQPASPGLKVIVTESLFSMEGDLAPLVELAGVAATFEAILIVDEAHATGLYGGQSGAGVVSELGLGRQVFATVHTGGKALGAAGAWVAGDHRLKDYLVNCSRPLIFSTAPAPATAVALQLAVNRWRETGALRARGVFERTAHLLHRLTPVAAAHGIGLPAVPGPIVPVILGGNARALAVARELQGAGFDVRAIRPPTVPSGTARLRITVTWPRSMDEIDRLAVALANSLDRSKVPEAGVKA